MVNKKAQDLSIGTLILIVLGIIVLVLLILGFSMGWTNLWEKINIFGGSTSIGDVATACNLAVTSQNTYDYCQNFRKIKVDGKVEYVTCEDPRITTESKITCESGKDYRKDKCIALLKEGSLKEDTKVNNAPCWNIYDCTNDLGGYDALKVNGCISTLSEAIGKTKAIESGFKDDTDDKICCVLP